MKIDAHGHACGYYNTVDDIRKNLDLNGLDKVILFPGEKDKKIDRLGEGKNREILYVTNIIGEFLGRFVGFDKVIDRRNDDVFEMAQSLPD